MPLLLLIRHARTDAADRHLTGWTPGVHLTEEGLEQARGLARRLAPVPLAAIYSSPLERCVETAEALAAARGMEVLVREDLGEVRYGAWTGRPLARVTRTRLWRALRQAPSSVRFPGGESLMEVQERAVSQVARILSEHPRGVVAVVTHSDVIRLLLAHFGGVHLDMFERLVVEPASISAVAAGDGAPRILRVNDTGTVEDLVPRAARRRKVRG